MVDKSRFESSSAKESRERFASGSSGAMNAENTPRPSAPSDKSFGDEVASLKDTVVSAGSGAMQSVRDAGEAVATQVGNAASGALQAGADAAAYAGEQAKTFASEIEGFARRNPLGAMGAALAVGVLIGLIGRSRS